MAEDGREDYERKQRHAEDQKQRHAIVNSQWHSRHATRQIRVLTPASLPGPPVEIGAHSRSQLGTGWTG